MYLTVIVGETGSGKSEIAKMILAESKYACVYDPQNEYGLPTFPDSKERFCLHPPKHTIQHFIKMVKACEGYTFMVDEGTGVFKGSVGMGFINEVLGKRHTHNKYVMIFHQLHRVPPDLSDFIDVIIMFKTGDMRKNIKIKYPEYLAEWDRIQASTVTHPNPMGKKSTRPENFGEIYTINDYAIIFKSNYSNEIKKAIEPLTKKENGTAEI